MLHGLSFPQAPDASVEGRAALARPAAGAPGGVDGFDLCYRIRSELLMFLLMASNPVAMASNLVAVASNLVAMASDGLQPNSDIRPSSKKVSEFNGHQP